MCSLEVYYGRSLSTYECQFLHLLLCGKGSLLFGQIFPQSITLGIMWGTGDVIHCVLFHETGECFGNIAWPIVTY